MSFKGKVVIVTGAARGIGLEICRQLVKQEAYVVLNDVDPVLAHEAVMTLNATFGMFSVSIPGDCRDMTVIQSLVNGAVSRFGKLDVAIANAGITLFGPFLTFSREAFAKILDVNIGGAFFLAQAAAGQMRQQGHGGSLLFMSSVTAHLAHRDLVAYGMTKGALECLARNLVVELSEYGININTVAPGATLTERTMLDDVYEATWRSITPNGQVGKVADVANAVLFLVSESARHITGQHIVVDGGWTSVGINP